MSTLPVTRLTEQQYLEIERLAPRKSEFHDGRMFLMAGGSPDHARLSTLINSLLNRLVPKSCRTYSSDLHVKVPAAGLYTYPDCTVVCGDLQTEGDAVLNPLLIAEVLSPSTEAYDRGKKFEMYRTLESLREYLLIHQDRPHVELYSRQPDGNWLLRDHAGPEATVAIPSLSLSFTLAELYAETLATFQP